MVLLKTKNKTRRVLLILSNLKFAILILLIIAGFSILGTIIEQNQSVEFYKQNYPENRPLFGIISWEIIQLFSLDNVYRSWWYLSLLVLLGSSLVICTFTQQLPILKIAKNWKFFDKKSQFRKLDLKLEIKGKPFEGLIHVLNKETYNIFQYNKSFFCYKGLIGRIAPIIVHASIIQIFLGAIIGAFFGFGGQEFVPKGEIFHLQNIINSGKFSTTPNFINTRVNNFWIDYSSNKESESVNQFYSDISILDTKGNELKRKVISVNNPLHYKDLTIYQSDWDISCLRVSKENERKSVQYQTKKVKIDDTKNWLSKIKLKDNEFNLLLKNLNKEISIFDKDGNFIKKVKEGKTFNYKEKDIFTLNEIVPSTGLDIKSDPGIPFVYFGFIFLILSTLLSFISFSKVWIFERSNSIYIGASSNRAKKTFESYFLKKVSESL